MKSDHGSAEPEKVRVLIAASEITPYAKTGGLGDVMGSLPAALQMCGADVSLVMPAYSCVLNGGYAFDTPDIHFRAPVSNRFEPGEILTLKNRDGISIYFVRSDKYFDREFLYGTPDGDYPDNAERFVFFSRAILELARRIEPQVIHVNDWQAALAVAFLKSQPARYPELVSTRTVITIHNLGYQGKFRTADWHLLNLDWSLFTPSYLEFYGDINFLKAGIVFADAITTVSPTYAEEIRTKEQGFGLEGVFKERSGRLFGILNGVDYRIWDPATDALIAQNYGPGDTRGKAACSQDLRRCFGLESDDLPLIGMVTRLSTQKGLDLVRDAFARLLRRGCRFALLGSGERVLQDSFVQLARQHKGEVGVEIAFSESLAHQIIAGSDILLMPSRYEPGGLIQLYGFKYGTIPVVRATGGLKDTVTHFDARTGKGNGFLFSEYSANGLVSAVDLALRVFNRKDVWAGLMRNAMLADFSWEGSARQYLDVYAKIMP